jgi:hypothetical protein
MDSDESKIPKEILDRLDALLRENGFRQSIPGLFVKNLDTDWRAWVGVTGYPFALLPTVGVYNENLLEISRTARATLGRPSRKKPDTGPPLIMANLERIIGDDPDCLKRISWDFAIEDHHLANPDSVPELKIGVVDDLVYCLRQKAYPFFSAHMTFQSIWDAANDRMQSPAFPNYFPIILMKLGRRSDVPRYLDERLRQIRNAEVAQEYREYVDELLKVVPA